MNDNHNPEQKNTNKEPRDLFLNDENKYGDEYKAHFFEQYKMFVETTNHVNHSRSSMNTFYISCNTLWIGITTAFCRANQFLFLSFSILGLAISVSWFLQLKVYRNNNREKYNIIHDIEKYLPIALYTKWDATVRKQKLIHSTSKFESIIPVIFALANLVLLIVACFFFPSVEVKP